MSDSIPTCNHSERNPYFDGRYCAVCKKCICIKCHAAEATVQETFCAPCAPPVPEDAGHEWPLRDVLARLADFADDRLTRKDYDGHGHEALRICVSRARQLLAVRERPTPCVCNAIGYAAAYNHCGCETCRRECGASKVSNDDENAGSGA